MVLVRVVVGLGALTIALAGCTTNPPPNEIKSAREGRAPSPSPPCAPGEPLRVKVGAFTTKIPSRCPKSSVEDVGYSDRIDLGSVLAKQPCRELPDFAGSWWRPEPPYPTHLKQVGRETISGTMTVVEQGRAQFVAPGFRTDMGGHRMRIPPKGRLIVVFTRIEGPIHVAGCD
jgi:hypothetical protein